MVDIIIFAWVMYVVQILHSMEELSTRFHHKWFFFTMSFRFFLFFEICFNLFWFQVLVFPQLPYRKELLAGFIVLMFAQSLWHLAWWAMKKHYVPGLITASLHTILFLVFYFTLISNS